MANTKKQSNKIAVVLIRGTNKLDYNQRTALKHLNLFRVNNCILLDDTPSNMGMVKRIKDFATYGIVSQETIDLISKRKKIGKTYLLSPPRGGVERKGIKRGYPVGGALGERDNMDELIRKMLA